MAAKNSNSAKQRSASVKGRSKSSAAKSAANRPASRPPRRLKQQTYKSYKLTRKIRSAPPPLRGSIRLFSQSISHLWRHWRIFGGILLIFGLLNLVLVHGFSATLNIADLKNALVSSGHLDQLSNSLNIFGGLLDISRTTNSDVGGLYQTFILLIGSLAVIWALRQTFAENKITAKDSFYKSMYPLVPFILVVLVITLEILPMLLAALIYSGIFGGGIALSGLENGLWGLLICGLILASLYMLSSTIFALYIVTLPDVTPLSAMRSARQLVRHRRWQVIRKFIALPIILLFLAIILMLPTIMFIPRIAEWLFFTLGLLAFMLVHSYGYTIYRGLL